MSKKNNNGLEKDKFQFVEMDEKNLEITKTFSLKDIVEAASKMEEKPKTKKKTEKKKVEEQPVIEKVIEEPVAEKEKEVKMEEVKPLVIEESKVTEVERRERLNKRFHFSFEARVLTMICCILLLFLGACFFILETIKTGRNEVVTYNETSNIGYNVCYLPNETYQQECLEENMQYLPALTNMIGAYFQYNVDFSTDISYDLAYHVVALTKIYDKNDSSKILYRSEDILVEKTSIQDTNHFISIDTDVSINYQKYYKMVQDYQNRYGLTASADLELILYLDEVTETREVASLEIPLRNTPYSIEKKVLNRKNQKVEIDGDFWNLYNSICAVSATIFILIALCFLYRTTRLVLRVTTTRNKYQARLSQILRDYDRIIVIARDGYESNVERQVIKVETFEELLDAQETLQKPIIYSRINDVKSEFIVEDDKTLYKYVLKESKL